MSGFEARGIQVHFGGVRALDGVDLRLEKGEILGLIGPNGAGKTTFVNAVSRFLKLNAGQVLLDGVEATNWSPHRLARHGVARTFQNVRIFGRLSALENVEAGAVGVGRERREARREAWRLLGEAGMADKAHVRADQLSFGEERRISILRAVAMRPGFLLLDEPGAGLDEAESDELMGLVRSVRSETGCGILVIEHDMRLIFSLCDRIQVLDYGKTIAVGSPAEVRRHPTVLEAYLGKEHQAVSLC